ncbi:spore germination protein GerPB [Caldifermentibacillus hisashii]|jgi:spore germination protein PB|uniref:spore germination protein GerPB n=1 Tax=Bacillaceae TaxID=186817 RepID=UPI000D55832F|nr:MULTISPECIES: spore germination protein GerPB [Bacillaceae]AWI11841.1 spore gernimation protein [Caldibacillus thermoamylovorans]MCM3797390.1 spore germination protein GerPB [Caldibacillus thermoamylovorans]MDL0419569.1 spore germination protein GerPB [Caldibacillus thermoamylovorans]MED3643505.1 spore germination protein GerPB [Caldifermentibacillus hisashii]
MNIYVQQTININILRINSIMNSSVLQIGTAGSINARTEAYNTGGFTGDAPEPDYEGFTSTTAAQPLTIPVQGAGQR